MKKLIFSAVLLASMVARSYGQGQVWVGNLNNTDTSNTAATSNGDFWIDLDGTAGNGAPVLVDTPIDTFNFVLLGGSTAGTISQLASFLNDPNWIEVSPGVYFDQTGTGYGVPGVPVGGTGFFQVFAWIGSETTYAAATAAGDTAGASGVFNSPVDFGLGAEPLDGMPAVILEVVPEPGSMLLAGLGTAALLIFRRRK